MPAGDVQVQSAVHSMDQGTIANLIKGGMFAVLIVALSLWYLFMVFRGLDNPTAMDQAQIARNLSQGKGYTTDYIRPLALGIVQKRSGNYTQVDLNNFPDFSQSPLNPWINSVVFRVVGGDWKMKVNDQHYRGDRLVAAVSIVFFILSVVAWYFVIARLFDPRLALFACGAVLLTDLMWRFSLSALPQMTVLFFFSLACLTTLFAIEANQREQLGLMIGWLIGAGICMGLMTLTHGLSAWIFLGWLIFAGIYFQPRGLAAIAALAAFVLVVSPWMVRNYQICGNPFGLSFYDAFYNSRPENTYLRNSSVNVGASGSTLKGKVRAGILSQTSQIAGFLGLNIAAAGFFVALFHPFRSRKTSVFKWCVLLMWLCALIGMTLYQPTGEVSENQFHVLFIPLFVGYGMAFLFVLWNRLELGSPLLRMVFVVSLMVLCAVPMILNLFGGSPIRIQWPPYVPPVIGFLNDWFQENEVVCSDMPWAVAWYAQRKSLLLPQSISAFNRIHDYNETVQRINGLFLTPITGNQRLMADIYKGPYKDWAQLITRPPQTRDFPLSAYYPLPIDGECIIFADRERWRQPQNN